MKKNDGFTLIELLVTLVIVGVIMTFIISMMSSQYAIIRDVDAYLVMSSENKDVNDAIMREFVKAEEIWIDGENILDPVFDIAKLNNSHDLTTIQLRYTQNSNEHWINFLKEDSESDGRAINELYMKQTIGGTEKDPILLGDHLAPTITADITFYRRLSLNRRVVALVKIKINYQHDGITKQYDLFYHLRNLQYPTN